MAWLTPDDMEEKGLLPCDVFDANGIIRRMITGFDPESGLVQSYVLDKQGNHVEDAHGVLLERNEQFAPPLIYQKISWNRAQNQGRGKGWVWDEKG